jgi:acetyltransferase
MRACGQQTSMADTEIASPLDPSNDPTRVPGSSLDPLFQPKTVAVIGATDKEGSVGRTLLWNLISHPFGGVVFPVNPKRSAVLGIKSYPSLSAIPDRVDLAVVVTPAPSVPGIMSECVANRVRAAIVISAGFKEAGPEGVELERQVLADVKTCCSSVRLPSA